MTEEQIQLYAEVRVRMPAQVRLYSISASDPYPFQHPDAPGAMVIGVAGRLDDRKASFSVRADQVRTTPDAMGWWVARNLKNGLGLTPPPKRLWGIEEGTRHG